MPLHGIMLGLLLINKCQAGEGTSQDIDIVNTSMTDLFAVSYWADIFYFLPAKMINRNLCT
jgi:hypothetical protein